jgi:glycosyltransferase involved in cell wall biosynthesis
VPNYVVRTQMPLQKGLSRTVDVSNQLQIGCLGSFHETKGFKELILAFRKANMPNQRLILGGNDQNAYGRACRMAAAGDSRIQFLGQANPSDFFRDIHLLVIPSLWKEPYPRVLVEAMSYALPVIASDCGGTKEGILPGETGFIFSLQSELVALLQHVGENLACLNKMRDAIIDQQSSVETDESTEYARIYRELLTH